MIEAGHKLGKFMSSTIRSPWWQNIRRGVNEIQHLPQRLMREAELEELNEIKKLTKDSLSSIGNKDLINTSSWVGNTSSIPAQKEEVELVPEKDSGLEKNTN
ncbi:MAG: hypothetical protein K8R16_13935 [Anaerolineales bacterium]|nr:hypothetical protein [Anaerolineales bacterium]